MPKPAGHSMSPAKHAGQHGVAHTNTGRHARSTATTAPGRSHVSIKLKPTLPRQSRRRMTFTTRGSYLQSFRRSPFQRHLSTLDLTVDLRPRSEHVGKG